MAAEQVRRALRPDSRFPQNVFVRDRSDFYFFDSDWMREADFVDRLKPFLEIEGSQCACLWKLDTEIVTDPHYFFVSRETTVDEYRTRLAGSTPGFGWLDAMERLACASDVGEWCMYCEPNNDIAVIALREPGASARYGLALRQFSAERIEQAIARPLSHSFSRLSEAKDWRDTLLRQYSSRS